MACDDAANGRKAVLDGALEVACGVLLFAAAPASLWGTRTAAAIFEIGCFLALALWGARCALARRVSVPTHEGAIALAIPAVACLLQLWVAGDLAASLSPRAAEFYRSAAEAADSAAPVRLTILPRATKDRALLLCACLALFLCLSAVGRSRAPLRRTAWWMAGGGTLALLLGTVLHESGIAAPGDRRTEFPFALGHLVWPIVLLLLFPGDAAAGAGTASAAGSGSGPRRRRPPRALLWGIFSAALVLSALDVSNRLRGLGAPGRATEWATAVEAIGAFPWTGAGGGTPGTAPDGRRILPPPMESAREFGVVAASLCASCFLAFWVRWAARLRRNGDLIFAVLVLPLLALAVIPRTDLNDPLACAWAGALVALAHGAALAGARAQGREEPWGRRRVVSAIARNGLACGTLLLALFGGLAAVSQIQVERVRLRFPWLSACSGAGCPAGGDPRGGRRVAAGDFADIARALEGALRTQPDHPETNRNFARLFMLGAEDFEAISPGARADIGLTRAGMVARAREHLRRAIVLDPANPGPGLDLACLLAKAPGWTGGKVTPEVRAAVEAQLARAQALAPGSAEVRRKARQIRGWLGPPEAGERGAVQRRSFAARYPISR